MKSQKKKNSKGNKSGDKMIIKLKPETINEIMKDEQKKEEKQKIIIFVSSTLIIALLSIIAPLITL